MNILAEFVIRVIGYMLYVSLHTVFYFSMSDCTKSLVKTKEHLIAVLICGVVLAGCDVYNLFYKKGNDTV